MSTCVPENVKPFGVTDNANIWLVGSRLPVSYAL